MGVDAKEEKRFLTLNVVVDGVHLADSKPDSIAIAEGLAKQMKMKVGDLVSVVTTTAHGSLNAVDLEVVGIFKTGIREIDNNFFYVHHETAKKLLRIEGGSLILIGFAGEDELKYKAKLTEVMGREFPDLEVVHWYEMAGDIYDNAMGWIEGLVRVFRIIIIAVATLSILNVFMISLLERIGEFGTLRAIGTYRSEIGMIILTESLLQSLIGGVAGVLFCDVGDMGPAKSRDRNAPAAKHDGEFRSDVSSSLEWNGNYPSSLHRGCRRIRSLSRHQDR